MHMDCLHILIRIVESLAQSGGKMRAALGRVIEMFSEDCISSS